MQCDKTKTLCICFYLSYKKARGEVTSVYQKRGKQTHLSICALHANVAKAAVQFRPNKQQ